MTGEGNEIKVTFLEKKLLKTATRENDALMVNPEFACDPGATTEEHLKHLGVSTQSLRKRDARKSAYEVHGKYHFTWLEVLLAFLLAHMKCRSEDLDPVLVADEHYEGDITAYVADIIKENGIPVPAENISLQPTRSPRSKSTGSPRGFREVVFARPPKRGAVNAKQFYRTLLNLLG